MLFTGFALHGFAQTGFCHTPRTPGPGVALCTVIQAMSHQSLTKKMHHHKLVYKSVL